MARGPSARPLVSLSRVLLQLGRRHHATSSLVRSTRFPLAQALPRRLCEREARARASCALSPVPAPPRGSTEAQKQRRASHAHLCRARPRCHLPAHSAHLTLTQSYCTQAPQYVGLSLLAAGDPAHLRRIDPAMAPRSRPRSPSIIHARCLALHSSWSHGRVLPLHLMRRRH